MADDRGADALLQELKTVLFRVAGYGEERPRPIGRPTTSKYAALIQMLREQPELNLDGILTNYRRRFGRSISEGTMPQIDKRVISRERSRLGLGRRHPPADRPPDR